MSRVNTESLDKSLSNSKGNEDSDNLYEDWLKSSPNQSPDRAPSIQTIIIKSVAQSYQDMFQNLYIEENIEPKDSIRAIRNSNNSNIASTAISFASPKENTGSLIGLKDLSRTFYASIVEQPQESDKDEELTLFYCIFCQKNTYPVVALRLKEMGLWSSVRYFFESFRCCSVGADLKEFHEYAYSCSMCKNIVIQKEVDNKYDKN